MRHVSRPTELLWIGCLTGSIWTQKFKSVTLIPSTNSQTCWHRKFSSDARNHFVCLFNISHFSSTCCIKNFSFISCSTMAKKIQNQNEEERVVSKSRPVAMKISSFIATSSSTASSPIVSKSPGLPKAARWALNQAHSTQRRRLKCD